MLLPSQIQGQWAVNWVGGVFPEPPGPLQTLVSLCCLARLSGTPGPPRGLALAMWGEAPRPCGVAGLEGLAPRSPWPGFGVPHPFPPPGQRGNCSTGGSRRLGPWGDCWGSWLGRDTAQGHCPQRHCPGLPWGLCGAAVGLAGTLQPHGARTPRSPRSAPALPSPFLFLSLPFPFISLLLPFRCLFLLYLLFILSPHVRAVLQCSPHPVLAPSPADTKAPAGSFPGKASR